MKLLQVGYGNVVVASRVVAIVNAAGAPLRRLREAAEERGKLVDVTQGRKTRSVIVTDSDHVILSAFGVDTMSSRMESPEELASE